MNRHVEISLSADKSRFIVNLIERANVNGHEHISALAFSTISGLDLVDWAKDWLCYGILPKEQAGLMDGNQ